MSQNARVMRLFLVFLLVLSVTVLREKLHGCSIERKKKSYGLILLMHLEFFPPSFTRVYLVAEKM